MLRLSYIAILDIFKKISVGLILFSTLIIFATQYSSQVDLTEELAKALFLVVIVDLSLSAFLWICYLALKFYFVKTGKITYYNEEDYNYEEIDEETYRGFNDDYYELETKEEESKEYGSKAIDEYKSTDEYLE